MNKKNAMIMIIILILVVVSLFIMLNNIEKNKTNDNPKEKSFKKQNSQENINKNTIESEDPLDLFYDKSITSKYKDIRELDEYYNKDEAKKDKCFVIGAMVYHDDLYYNFMNNYKNKKDAFIRVVQNTIEGDAIIYDLKYDSKQDKIFLVIDNTRDKYSADEDRKITIKEFEKTSEYKTNNHLYWVVYNGELNDETFESENVFEVVLIN